VECRRRLHGFLVNKIRILSVVQASPRFPRTILKNLRGRSERRDDKVRALLLDIQPLHRIPSVNPHPQHPHQYGPIHQEPGRVPGPIGAFQYQVGGRGLYGILVSTIHRIAFPPVTVPGILAAQHPSISSRLILILYSILPFYQLLKKVRPL